MKSGQSTGAFSDIETLFFYLREGGGGDEKKSTNTAPTPMYCITSLARIS